MPGEARPVRRSRRCCTRPAAGAPPFPCSACLLVAWCLRLLVLRGCAGTAADRKEIARNCPHRDRLPESPQVTALAAVRQSSAIRVSSGLGGLGLVVMPPSSSSL